MLEALIHDHFKKFQQLHSDSWSHNLTLSRLIGRSLRLRDNTLVQINGFNQKVCWPGILIPLLFDHKGVVIVTSDSQRKYLEEIELPLLAKYDFFIPIWQGLDPPPLDQIWLINYNTFIKYQSDESFVTRRFIFPEADILSKKLSEAMSITIDSSDLEDLINKYSKYNYFLLDFYNQLRRKIFSRTPSIQSVKSCENVDLILLQEIIRSLNINSDLWSQFIQINTHNWVSWFDLYQDKLDWQLKLKPMESLRFFNSFFKKSNFILISRSEQNFFLKKDIKSLSLFLKLSVSLGSKNERPTLKIFAPKYQPLPNTEIFSDYLIEQCRRLLISRTGLTIILLDDQQFRSKLAACLASDFGTRVLNESMILKTNSVIFSSYAWWLNAQSQLPSPDQIIIALLPIPSLRSSEVAARVDLLKEQGLDWFRDFLLPEALQLMPSVVDPLRDRKGRFAILDGRLRARSWGSDFLKVLEPWESLDSLVPD